MRKLVFVFLLTIVFSCTSLQEKDENIFDIASQTKFLGHKGSGTFGENFNHKYPENTISSVLHAINQLDGSEFDLQISADTTLWLFHDHKILNCDSVLVNFSTLNDLEIFQISKCNYQNQLAKFSDLMDTLAKSITDEKIISLDLKVLRNEQAISMFGDKLQLANKVVSIIEKYKKINPNLKFLIETPSIEQYDIANKNLGLETFLVLYNTDDLTKAQQNRKDLNISIDFFDLKNRKQPIRVQNEKLQMWTPNRADEMIFVLKHQPNYIQSDNIDLSKFFAKLRDKKPQKNIFETSSQKISSSSEFHPISVLEIGKESENFMFQFNSNILVGDDELLLIFSAENSDKTKTYWTSFNLKNDLVFEFVNVEYFKENGFETLHLYLWNINKKPFEISDWKLSKIK